MNFLLIGLILAMAPPAGNPNGAPPSAPAAAQTAPAVPTPGLQPLPRTYVLGPDDVISIHVLNYDKFDIPELTVPPDGKVKFQLLDTIIVAGKTTDELGQFLTTQWSNYLNDISVTVTLIRKRNQVGVSIFGYAQRSATIEYRPNLKLLDVIAAVGGAGPEGDLSRLVLTHRDGTSLTLDLSHPETKGSTAANLPLAEGDIIFVPQRHEVVTITGEVGKPGDVEYHEGLKLLDAINQVGGVKDDTADLAGAILTHNGKQMTINLDGLYKHGETDKNLTLSPGDTLQIPEIRNRTYVFGSVGRSGWYNFKPGDRILDALTAQGGPSQEADLNRIIVISVDKQKNASKLTKVNLNKFLHNGDLKENIALNAGDVVFVPVKKQSFNVSNLLSIVLGLNIIRSTGSLLSNGF